MNTVSFDSRMGSDIFSIKLVHAEQCRLDVNMSDKSIDNVTKEELDSAIYVQKFTNEAFKLLHQSMMEYSTSAKERLANSIEVVQFLTDNPDYKAENLLSLAKDAGGEPLVKAILKGQSIRKTLLKADMEAILYKAQPIYPTLIN